MVAAETDYFNNENISQNIHFQPKFITRLYMRTVKTMQVGTTENIH